MAPARRHNLPLLSRGVLVATVVLSIRMEGVTFLASEIFATPSFSASSILTIACIGMKDRCTPSNSFRSRSSRVNQHLG